MRPVTQHRALVAVVPLLLLPFVGTSPLVAAPEQQLESWQDWYPVDRGQAPGQRALNWWSHGEHKPNPAQSVYGQSTTRLAIPPATFPDHYRGHKVTYFTNWVCPVPPMSSSGFTRDDCRFDETTYVEYISQGTATRDPHNLEHWARGNLSHWEVYYDPASLKSCSGPDIRAADITREMLERADWKEPLVLKLPSSAGAFAVSTTICTLVFQTAKEEPTTIIDSQSGLWFVVTHNLDRLKEGDTSELIHAINEYYTNNPLQIAEVTSYCAQRLDIILCLDGKPKTRSNGDVQATLFMAEEYWMRRVPSDNLLANGFTRFRWWLWTSDVWDDPELGTNPTTQIWHLTDY